MSSITGLISGGGGGAGTPINGISKFQLGGQALYTDASSQVWLKSGNILIGESATYPDAIESFEVQLTGSTYDSKSFSTATQEAAPRGFDFNADGTKLYVSGDSTDVFQYSLSTAWDISTASYDSVTLDTGLANPRISFADNGSKLYLLNGTSAYQYSLSTAYDLSTASYDSKSFTFTTASSLILNDTGELAIWQQAANVYTLRLTTPFDISTAYNMGINFSLSSQDSSPQSICFSQDGLFMFMTGTANDRVHHYELSEAFNVSTAVYKSWFSAASQSTTPLGVRFSSSLDKAYVLDFTTDTIYQYSPSIVFNYIGLKTTVDQYDYLRIK